ncbi:cell division protein ZapA [Rickettsiales endosymbiont of Peranema trichophorum]|uniref:cell division protein ZapA n=1 Tax=Rickettsiales endosymbiont of Peranema trichophorum TaxID=2486577 RepID=UPI0010231A86|nr:cell division protein ZapA [Rickettsiales endosymbiont of Peranema trichophorum]RZI47165.1 cell division protein ZapA [Rickettsiales endosymbiont of Peranema trichophorum]
MKPIILKFRNHEIPIYCNEKEKVLELSEKLNKKVDESYQSQQLSDIKKLYLTTLSILEELETAKAALVELHQKDDKVLADSLSDITQQIRSLVNTLEQ